MRWNRGENVGVTVILKILLAVEDFIVPRQKAPRFERKADTRARRTKIDVLHPSVLQSCIVKHLVPSRRMSEV